MTGLSSSSSLFRLDGKVAVVTGGSRGLGLAMATAFAEQGASVVVASRKVDACTAAAEEIAASTGRPTLGVACHVGRWGDCDHMVDAVYDRFGRIDVLVNNAGMSPLYPSLAEVTEELWDKVFAVNLKGAFRLSSLVGTRMAEGEGGSIINVSSIAAVQPTSSELPYAAAKAALNCLTVGLSRSFGPTVRVNCMMPGAFLTDISEAWDMDVFEKATLPTIAAGRAGHPSEVIGTALYLASPASSYTNGAVVKVDGGTAFAPA